MKTIVLFCMLLSGIFAVSAAEAQRIAVVDVGRVIQQYYKSRIAAESLRNQAEIFNSYLAKQEAAQHALRKEYLVADDAAKNIAISEVERKKFRETADAKARELLEKRRASEEFAADRKRQLGELEMKKRQEILDDIAAEVKRRAAIDGFHFVLNGTGRGNGDLPFVVWHSSAFDLTEAVIEELNRASRKPTAQEKEEGKP